MAAEMGLSSLGGVLGGGGRVPLWPVRRSSESWPLVSAGFNLWLLQELVTELMEVVKGESVLVPNPVYAK